jgi:hypothetical protein
VTPAIVFMALLFGSLPPMLPRVILARLGGQRKSIFGRAATKTRGTVYSAVMVIVEPRAQLWRG